MTIRNYPLKIQNCSVDDCATLMSMGHHGDPEFLEAARAYWGEPLKGFDSPERTWWRAVPDSTGEHRFMYHEAAPHARGAFPVTAITQW